MKKCVFYSVPNDMAFEDEQIEKKVKNCIREEVLKAIKNGCQIFATTLTCDCCLVFCEVVNALKKDYQISLETIVATSFNFKFKNINTIRRFLSIWDCPHTNIFYENYGYTDELDFLFNGADIKIILTNNKNIKKYIEPQNYTIIIY